MKRREPQCKLQMRLPKPLHQQLRALADRNVTTLSAEVCAALRKHLFDNGLWPPPETKRKP